MQANLQIIESGGRQSSDAEHEMTAEPPEGAGQSSGRSESGQAAMEVVMYVEIDFNSDEAIYQQLRDQIILGIATSTLTEGQVLPSVRQLAEDIGINMHTVNKTYTLLKQEGFIKVDRRRGCVVAVDADELRAKADCEQDLRVILAEAICRGVPRSDVHDMIDLVRRLYRIRSCSKQIVPGQPARERPCLNYYIGQCDAPCQGNIPEESYRKRVEQAVDFLNGNTKDEISRLTRRMEEASGAMQYEEAAACRDLIQSIRVIGERQKITGSDGNDRDVIALAADTVKEANSSMGRTEAVAQVFFVRDGKLIGREHFFLTAEDTDDPARILRNFIAQYYAGTPFVPKELMLEQDVPERALLEEWLTKRRGSKVSIRVPQRGMKEKLVEMARENAVNALQRDRERMQREALRTVGAVREIADLLGLGSADRMEAYDISNISGFESVGSMVVYDQGRPKRTDYRKFRIRTVQGPNDYASMEEVLTRRFQRAKDGSAGFSRLPDLILMDGGRGQVHIAEKVLHAMQLAIPVAGMVKDDYHRTRGLWYREREVPIRRDSEGFRLITRIQDEAHRFAIEYHRLLRSKGQVRSVLDDIEGIGTVRRKALLRAFGSAEGIRDASLDELTHAPSMNAAAAAKVYAFFHPEPSGNGTRANAGTEEA